MICVICKHEETRPGKVTVTLERDGMTLIAKGVPASVCPNCGEQYVDEEIAEGLLQIAEEAARAGVRVEIREYATA
jgi:YgiT-type zinc finger domain-containing protein